MDYSVHKDIWLTIAGIGTVRVGSSISVTDRDNVAHTGVVKEIREHENTIFIVLITGYVFNIDNAMYLRIDP